MSKITTRCDTKRLAPANYFTRAIIDGTNLFCRIHKNRHVTFSQTQHILSKNKMGKQLCAKHVHRTEGSEPRFHGFWGSQNGVNFLKNWEIWKTTVFPRKKY